MVMSRLHVAKISVIQGCMVIISCRHGHHMHRSYSVVIGCIALRLAILNSIQFIKNTRNKHACISVEHISSYTSLNNNNKRFLI